MKTMIRPGLLALALLCLNVPQSATADPLADFGVLTPRERLPAPDFSLTGLDGKQVRLSDYRGKVVLLHFWATYCKPCRTEMPAIHRISEEFGSRGLKVICVNVDRGNRQGVEAFMRDIHLHFSTLLDPDGQVRRRYEIIALPTSYIIGRDGKFTGRIIGERDWAGSQVTALFEHLMAGKNRPAEERP